MTHVNRVDHRPSPLDPATTTALAAERAKNGRVTNMKATLLHSIPAYRVFSDWHIVKDEVRTAIGERALSLFSHAISSTAGCLLCSTYFRRLLIDSGIKPESFTPSEDEALLIELGYAIGNPAEPPKSDLMQRLKQRYDDRTLVNLVAYGGTMLATNVFNTLLKIDLDEYLEPYRLADAPTHRPADRRTG